MKKKLMFYKDDDSRRYAVMLDVELKIAKETCDEWFKEISDENDVK